MAFFPFGTAIFAPFRPKSQVFPATFRLPFGELPTTKRRRPRRPFVTKFAVSSPFAAWGFSFLLYARRGSAPQFAASPCESPRPPKLRRFAVRKLARPPELRRFAVEKSTWPPGFSLRRAKVHHPARLSHFAVGKFSASPWKSPPNHPVFHFAVRKSTSPPGFPLRHRELPQFALVKPPRGGSIPAGPPGATAAPSRVNFRQIPAPGAKRPKINKAAPKDGGKRCHEYQSELANHAH